MARDAYKGWSVQFYEVGNYAPGEYVRFQHYYGSKAQAFKEARESCGKSYRVNGVRVIGPRGKVHFNCPPNPTEKW